MRFLKKIQYYIKSKHIHKLIYFLKKFHHLTPQKTRMKHFSNSMNKTKKKLRNNTWKILSWEESIQNTQNHSLGSRLHPLSNDIPHKKGKEPWLNIKMIYGKLKNIGWKEYLLTPKPIQNRKKLSDTAKFPFPTFV